MDIYDQMELLDNEQLAQLREQKQREFWAAKFLPEMLDLDECLRAIEGELERRGVQL